MITYKLFKNNYGEINAVIKYEENKNWGIPFDPANTDYQAYLKWLSESPDNAPLPADE